MMDEAERDDALVGSAIALLVEHFDSVQIFCTRDNGGIDGTTSITKGVGNWFARVGQVREWQRFIDKEIPQATQSVEKSD